MRTVGWRIDTETLDAQVAITDALQRVLGRLGDFLGCLAQLDGQRVHDVDSHGERVEVLHRGGAVQHGLPRQMHIQSYRALFTFRHGPAAPDGSHGASWVGQVAFAGFQSEPLIVASGSLPWRIGSS